MNLETGIESVMESVSAGWFNAYDEKEGWLTFGTKVDQGEKVATNLQVLHVEETFFLQIASIKAQFKFFTVWAMELSLCS